MQMLVAALGACSSIDVLSILQKMQQTVREYRVDLVAERQENAEPPNLFLSYHLHFVLNGDLNPKLVKRAIDLSMTKYCSVARTLEQGATISYDFELLP
jgi:putative redox protein